MQRTRHALGISNELYDRVLNKWNRYDRKIDNKVSGASAN